MRPGLRTYALQAEPGVKLVSKVVGSGDVCEGGLRIRRDKRRIKARDGGENAVVVDVQSVVSREKNPQQPGVVTIGAIQGGTAGNIIPDEVMVRGTIRSYDPEVRAKLLAGVERVALAAAMMAGAPKPEINKPQGADSVVNDPELTERTAAVFRQAFGQSAIPKRDFITASEDFSQFALAGVPRSLFFEIGIYDPGRVQAARNGGPPLPFNHSLQYAPVPEPSIRTGVKAMSLAVLNVLGG